MFFFSVVKHHLLQKLQKKKYDCMAFPMRAWRSTSLLRSEGQQFVRAFCTCNKFSLSKPQMPMGDGIFWCWVGGFFVVYLLTPWAPADSRGMNKEDVNTGKKACGGPPGSIMICCRQGGLPDSAACESCCLQWQPVPVPLDCYPVRQGPQFENSMRFFYSGSL